MTTPTCAKCQQIIPAHDINVAQDVAYCRSCNISYRLSELTYDDGLGAPFDLDLPPAGSWFTDTGARVVIGSTNRNLAQGFGVLLFAVFWNGITSLFVVLALASTLRLLHVPLPVWFPAPKVEGGGEMTSGMTLFLWLFLTPFILIGLGFGGCALSVLFGRTEVQIDDTQGTVFNGIGSLGWKRRFDTSEVKSVRLHHRRNGDSPDTFLALIEMRDGKQLKFGSLLTNERRRFMLAALRKMVLHY